MNPWTRVRRTAPIVSVLLLLASCSPSPPLWHGTTYDDPQPAAPLSGEATQGLRPETILEQGTPVLLYFGYTHCQDECPATLGTLAIVARQLGAEAGQVRFVFVTVDPSRDDLATLADYLEGFDPSFLGVHTDLADLPRLLAAYGATAFQEGAAGDAGNDEGVIAHTTRLFLIDQEGRLRVHYPYDTTPEDLVSDLRAMLAESG